MFIPEINYITIYLKYQGVEEGNRGSDFKMVVVELHRLKNAELMLISS